MPDFFSPAQPPPLKKRHTDRLWCHPPPPFLPLSPPLPTQACDVTVSDNEVRILLHQSVRMTATQASLVSGALCWPLGAPSLLPVSSSGALQSGRSRVDLRMTSREWQCLGQPTPTATCRSQRHKGTQAAPALLLLHEGSSHSGGGIYIQEEGSALCVFSMNTGGNVRGRGRTAEETQRQRILWLLKH